MFELEQVEHQHIPVAHLIPPIDLAATWERHASLWQSALDYSPEPGDTLEAVSQAIAKGRAWVVDMLLGDQILGSVVLETVQTKQGKMLNIWLCAGDNLDHWIDEMLEFIENWAVVLEAKGIQLTGRTGWAKTLKSSGYKPSHVRLVKGLV
jgi:hypothetical protein